MNGVFITTCSTTSNQIWAATSGKKNMSQWPPSIAGKTSWIVDTRPQVFNIRKKKSKST